MSSRCGQQAKYCGETVDIRQARLRECVTRVLRKRHFEMRNALAQILLGHPAVKVPALQVVLIRLEAACMGLRERLWLAACRQGEQLGNGYADFRFHSKDACRHGLVIRAPKPPA